MQRLLDFIFNIHKLWSKRYAVVFFEYDRLPEVGDTITVGNLRAVFQKEEEETTPVVEHNGDTFSVSTIGNDPILSMPFQTLSRESIFACRKCNSPMESEYDGSTKILKCTCGFRTVA